MILFPSHSTIFKKIYILILHLDLYEMVVHHIVLGCDGCTHGAKLRWTGLLKLSLSIEIPFQYFVYDAFTDTPQRSHGSWLCLSSVCTHREGLIRWPWITLVPL